MFPIGDDDRELSGPAYITIFLVVANVVVFLLQLADPNITAGWSVVPREITTGQDLVGIQTIRTPNGLVQIIQGPGPSPIYLTLISAMFMHGGLMHLLGNMIYLWIFGDNVEHRFGPLPFLVFYLVSGLVGSLTQIALNPESTIPNLGASGAISGVLGAYLILFPRNRVHAIFFYQIISIPASVAIGIWIIFQFINGIGTIAATSQTGGVAYGAHIGGFAAGAVLALIMRVLFPKEKVNVLTRVQRADSRRWW